MLSVQKVGSTLFYHSAQPRITTVISRCRNTFQQMAAQLSMRAALALNKLLSLEWRHNEPDGVSNHQRSDCLLNRLIGRR